MAVIDQVDRETFAERFEVRMRDMYIGLRVVSYVDGVQFSGQDVTMTPDQVVAFMGQHATVFQTMADAIDQWLVDNKYASRKETPAPTPEPAPVPEVTPSPDPAPQDPVAPTP